MPLILANLDMGVVPKVADRQIRIRIIKSVSHDTKNPGITLTATPLAIGRGIARSPKTRSSRLNYEDRKASDTPLTQD
jgi:hypothetical protein